MGMSADAYRDQLLALLPPGAAFCRDFDGNWARLFSAFAEEFARIEARSLQLIEESDPRTTSEMFYDWERVYGLPDECCDVATTLAERRLLLLAKIRGVTGQTLQRYIDLAAMLGYTITIDEFHAFVADGSDAEDPVNDDEWAHVWRVNAPEVSITEFAADDSSAEDPLRSWGNSRLECVINRSKPAHTLVQFAYT